MDKEISPSNPLFSLCCLSDKDKAIMGGDVFIKNVKRKKQEVKMKDIEYKMYCDCSDPWHFIWFGFSTTHPWTGKEVIERPELWIRGEFFHGTLWKRIKNAIKYIIKGSYSAQVDLVFFGKDKIGELNKFTKDCLIELEKSGEQGD